MKVIFIFILLGISVISKGQNEKYLFTVIKKGYNSVTIIDNDIFKQLEKSRSKGFLYLNDQLIDSSGIKFSSNPILINNKLYAFYSKNPGDPYILYSLDLNGRLNKLGVLDSIYLKTTPFYYVGIKVKNSQNEKKVSIINPASNELNFICDFSDPKEYFLDGYYKISAINPLDTNKAVIEICECIGGCVDCSYYICDSKNNISNVTHYKKREKGNDHLKIEIIINDPTRSFFYGRILNSTIYTSNNDYVFDNTLNIACNALRKNIYFPNFEPNAGYNFIKGKYSSFNISSQLDNKEKVIIPYKFSMHLEKVMYNVIHDSIIIENEFAGLGFYELNILKNLIYAKHNFKFEDEFYQSYFNLFDFYSSEEKLKSRVVNINKSLTINDRLNLKRMNALLKQLNND